MLGSCCPRCACSVALHEGVPVVTPSGAVELWHRSCEAPPAPAIEVIAAPVRARRRWPFGIGAAVLAIGFVAWPRSAQTHAQPPAPAPASAATKAAANAAASSFDLGADDEIVAIPARGTARDDAPPPGLTDEQRYPVPIVDGQPLDEQFPSLLDWIHPVTDAAEKMPPELARHFGAERKGIMRTECGAGHCGVDLDGPRGRAIVAVADGVVVRVEHHELGLDGRSGRYVRIEHDDGTLTAYMHLDDIAEGLDVGDRVDGGQLVGYLGSTACYAAVAHLHFSLEIPNHPGLHGDNTDTHYVDPAPFLVRAHLAPSPDRRHAAKPLM